MDILRRNRILEAVDDEVTAMLRKHGNRPWARHEAIAILREEFEEAWDVIKADGPQEDLEDELLQVAGVCVRYLEQEHWK